MEWKWAVCKGSLEKWELKFGEFKILRWSICCLRDVGLEFRFFGFSFGCFLYVFIRLSDLVSIWRIFFLD